MSDLAALNRAVQADKGAAKSVKAWIAQATAQLEPPAPPPSNTVNPPVPPITNITNATGLGLNVTGPPADFHDYVSGGTFDSAVLLGPAQGGSSFERFHLVAAASVGDGPGYGRHALYCKAPNVSCSDWAVTMNPSAKDVGSGWSVRFAGFSLNRFSFSGLWFASLFDDDPKETPGFARFSNGTAVFAAEAAILLDSQIVYAVTLSNIAFSGPSNLIATVDSGSKVGTWTVTGCTINGKPAAAAAFQGIPAAQLHIT